MTSTPRPVIVIAATPTPNGDLHVGHLAGPYLAADVYARRQRSLGRPVSYVTVTDDHQTYVAASARRLGVPPDHLRRTATEAIERSLAAAGVALAGLPPVDDGYRAAVIDFVTGLHRADRLRRKRVRLPYAVGAGRYLYDGLVSGTCPVCLAGSSGGACEDCGCPNNGADLIDPHDSLDPADRVEYREVEILVLPLEEYRTRLAGYYASVTRDWRPRARDLVAELLSRPLPDVPVTVPGSWGIASPFPGTEGQVLYPWIEAMPAVMYGTSWSARRAGEPDGPYDRHWLADADPEIVCFHGFDNVYHWAMVDVAMLLAHGDRYTLPTRHVCNEFYELAGDKFSTSRNHLILGIDLLGRMPRDLVRYHLCATAPETQRANFTEAELAERAGRLLVEPWNLLADAMSVLSAGEPGTPVPTSAAGRRRAAAMAQRFGSAYAPGRFSPRQVGTLLTTHVDRLAALAAAACREPALAGDVFLEVRALVAQTAPVLVDVAARLVDAGVDLDPGTAPAAAVLPFRLPRLADPREREDAPNLAGSTAMLETTA